jgi:intracellular septation protein A
MREALKSLFEDLLSTIVFLVLFAITGSAAITVAVSVAVGLCQIAFETWRGRPVAPLQWLSIALVLIFGGASWFTHDTRFIMFKPTLIYCAIGIAMVKKDWLDRYLPTIAHDNLPRAVIVGSGYAWALMMFALGAGNFAIAMTFDRPTWVLYNTVVPLAAKFAAFGIQYLVFRTMIVRKLRRPAAA